MNNAKYIIILTIVSSLRYIISLRYLPTSKFNITLKITKLLPFFDPTEFLRVLYRGVGTMIRARVRVERSRKGWSWKDGWNGEKRGRWDICNSNPIFDLVPLSPLLIRRSSVRWPRVRDSRVTAECPTKDGNSRNKQDHGRCSLGCSSRGCRENSEVGRSRGFPRHGWRNTIGWRVSSDIEVRREVWKGGGWRFVRS